MIAMLPIYNESYRPSSNWTQELTLKRDALQKHQPFSPELEAKIQEHLLVDQVVQNLLLGDIQITAERARDLINGAAEGSQPADRATISFANGVRYLNTLVANQESKAQFLLTSDLLRELHALTMEGIGEGGGFYRTAEGRSLAPGHEPASAEVLPMLIDNALDWFSADSFGDLHPVEQAWLVHL